MKLEEEGLHKTLLAKNFLQGGGGGGGGGVGGGGELGGWKEEGLDFLLKRERNYSKKRDNVCVPLAKGRGRVINWKKLGGKKLFIISSGEKTHVSKGNVGEKKTTNVVL